MTRLLHAIACVVVLASATAYADDKVEAAKLFDLGKRHYNLQEFDDAIAQFKSAYKKFPDPVYLFNIAQAYRLKGNDWCGLAAQFYTTYQREETDKKLRDSVKKRRDEMEACAKKHPQKAEPPPPPPTTGTGATEPPIGAHVPVAPLTVPPPATPTTSPNLPPAQPLTDEDPARSRRVLGKILMVTGGVSVVTGLVLWVRGSDAEGRVKECRSDEPEPDECYLDAFGLDLDEKHIRQLERQRDNAYSGAFISLTAGVVAIAAGYYIHKRAKRKADAPRVTITPTRNGAAFAWSF